MARYNLGGGAADFAFSVTSGNLLRLAPTTLYVWEDETGDTRVTDLLLNGVAASVIPVASDGQIPTFQGPDGVASLWVSAGENGTRVLLAAPGQPGPEGPPGPPGGADDADVALAVTSGTETKAALSAAYVGASGKVDDLPTPFYVAHRAGGLLAPEASMTASRVSAAMGAHAIEFDVRTLADGTAAVMHDATVDRTTTGTGNVSDFNSVSWQKLQIDSAGLMGGSGWPVEYAPLFETMVREFGNKLTLAPQAYDADALLGIDRIIEKYNVSRDTIIFQTNSYTDADAAYALGYRHILSVAGDLSTNLTEAASHHVTMVAVPEHLATSTWVNAVHAAGMKAVVYSVNTHYRRDALIELGVDGMFTDDPGYLSGTYAKKTTDLFGLQVPTSGHERISGSGSSFVAPDELQLTGTSTGAVKLGYMEPPSLTSFTLNYEVNLAVTASLGFMWLGKHDYWTSPAPAGPPAPIYDGYLISILGSGVYRIEVWNDGARTSYLDFNIAITSFPALGSWLAVRITVTPTQITLTFPATGQTVTKTNSEQRPVPRVVVGNAGGTVKYRNLALS